jgi:hypothetical protein
VEVLLLAAMAASNILCFVIGAKIGQTVSKGKEIKIPNVNPVEAVREHRSKKEAEMAQDRLATIMRNIECFDGTSRGQEDVPGR